MTCIPPSQGYDGGMEEIQAMTPVEIDTVLSKNWQEQAMVSMRSLSTLKTIERLVYQRERDGKLMSWDQRNLDDAQTCLEEYSAEMNRLRAQARPYQVEFARRGGWNRYYLVTNSNGHVHRGMDCITCFDTTQYAWIVDLADCDEAKMIEEYGEKACTVCFPDAPANPHFSGPGRRDREAVEARAAEKAARQATKDAKSITDVDGSPLRDGMGYPIKTKVAARNELTRAIEWASYYGTGTDHEGSIRTLVPALEAAGVDWRKPATNKVKAMTKEHAAHAQAVQDLLKELGL